jgi:hypothetical protein
VGTEDGLAVKATQQPEKEEGVEKAEGGEVYVLDVQVEGGLG